MCTRADIGARCGKRRGRGHPPIGALDRPQPRPALRAGVIEGRKFLEVARARALAMKGPRWVPETQIGPYRSFMDRQRQQREFQALAAKFGFASSAPRALRAPADALMETDWPRTIRARYWPDGPPDMELDPWRNGRYLARLSAQVVARIDAAIAKLAPKPAHPDK